MYAGPPATIYPSTSYIELFDELSTTTNYSGRTYTLSKSGPFDPRNRKARRTEAAKARDQRVRAPKRKKRRG